MSNNYKLTEEVVSIADVSMRVARARKRKAKQQGEDKVKEGGPRPDVRHTYAKILGHRRKWLLMIN